MVKVLVWGYNEGPCSVYRDEMYDPLYADLGVEVRRIDALRQETSFTDLDGNPLPAGTTPAQALALARQEKAHINIDIRTEDLDWCDVVMFRRYYNTHYACSLKACPFRTLDAKAMAAHEHPVKMDETRPGRIARDDITAVVWKAAEKCDNKGLIYECDDLLVGPALSRWNGFWPDVLAQQSLIARMAKRADIMTVSTPILARYFSALSNNVRVVRNSINPDLYGATTPRPDTKPRLLYYAQAVRLRDYAGYPDDVTQKWNGGYARAAVNDHRKALRTVFMGASPGWETDLCRKYFAEVYPYADIKEFPVALCNTHPDIGIAPLMGDTFDQGKSELHWLEYTMAGAATLAYRYNGDGPYNVIRDGVDGVLARGRAEWSDGLSQLLDPAFREDVAGAARERVLAEYDYRDRAKEWAEVFRWAAEHPGYNRRDE